MNFQPNYTRIFPLPCPISPGSRPPPAGSGLAVDLVAGSGGCGRSLVGCGLPSWEPPVLPQRSRLCLGGRSTPLVVSLTWSRLEVTVCHRKQTMDTNPPVLGNNFLQSLLRNHPSLQEAMNCLSLPKSINICYNPFCRPSILPVGSMLL